jgi:serine protease Do
MRPIIALILMLFASGCAQSGYMKFYTPHLDPSAKDDVAMLGDGELPVAHFVDDLVTATNTWRTKGYVVLGYSSFNGPQESQHHVISQAKRVGATLVLYTSRYTDTESSTSALILPTTQTTYHSGSMFTSSGSNAFYSGTSTSQSTTVVPYTITQRRHGQAAVYLVKYTGPMRFGISLVDLTPAQRSQLGRNTGAVVDVVVDGTPAFIANVVAEDVLIAVDGQLVTSAEQGLNLLRSVGEVERCSLTILRGNTERQISVKF